MRASRGAAFEPLRALRRLLPEGAGLDQPIWLRRHHSIVAILWLHVLGLPIYGAVRGYGALHSAGEGALVALLALAASQPRGGRRPRSIMAAAGLMTASALLVHFSNGSIETHFHFFVMIAVLSLYQDWVPFLVALGYVVVHHGLLGVLHPTDVYNHTDAIAHPWRWALIHGGFVLCAAAANTYSWRTSEEDHRRAVAEARRSEETFRALFEHNPQSMWVFDLETLRFLAVNPAAVAKYGYSEAEFLQLRVSDIRPPGDVPRLQRRLAQGAEGDVGAWTHRTRSGEAIRVMVHAQSIEFRGRAAKLSVITDITERVRLEEQLRRHAGDLEQANRELASSNRELEQFAYISAHDLQEPLRMVTSYVQLLERRYHGHLDGDADEFIGYAVEGSLRMQALISDLLSFSRVGRGEVELATVSVEDIVAMARHNLLADIRQSGAEVSCAALPSIRADAGQLTALFQNLIGNAIKFQREVRPRVEISAEPEGEGWRFAVRDNGIGIDPQHRERIFDVFQRLHTRDEFPGTGIGLAICKKIVERHGGRIGVEAASGGGSTFWFSLPGDGCRPPRTAPDDGRARAPGRARPRRAAGSLIGSAR